ncbi:hypothetical protein MPTK1_7g07080 [Marchantia polymorpha subsp. ruderalis]|uniref:Uncharacterized protein n=2 Tax=Marchantia polymorpha TaxID=3197 RepID=A0A176VN02_MARPO|nr:hypothetical protein AXG93_1504s1400 [Marchantia polymorpha subsp. ruderalis]PTQ34854.1 hypothetical protein MARPO_0076s0086 [Marchantia polymorpha]BBN16524.1 hypothetical protein Mp_7g07080 [Marchantia polymorpha subsp. ruderalis]|eukprot:PTQ34854.1 hypothetical protein MARPO_0076s0086 [Marchantia polymorpha]
MVDGEASSGEGLRSRKGEKTDVACDDCRGGKMKADSGVTSSGTAANASCSAQEPSVSERTGSGNAAGVPPGGFMAPDGPFRGFMPMPFGESWPMNPSMLGSGFDFGSLGPPPLVPVLVPGPFPGFYQPPGHEHHPHQGGIFAVPIMPMFGPMGGVPQGGFIPLSFNMPPAAPPAPVDGQAPATSPAGGPGEAGRAQGDGLDAAAQDGIRQRQPALRGALAGGRADNQRVVRRFRVGFQVDLLLILKLAVVVFVFNQDGSKDRFLLLFLLAGIVYLYQTGALAPILRWVSQSAQRAMMPPQQPIPVTEGGQNREGGGVPQADGREARVGAPAAENREAAALGVPPQEGVVGQGEGAPVRAGAEGAAQPPQNPNWWGFFKEVQMIVVGFLTSLFPGFQHVD